MDDFQIKIKPPLPDKVSFDGGIRMTGGII